MSARALLLAPLSAAVVLALAGCGSATPHSSAPNAQQEQAAFRGAPRTLGALHAQADQLLGGGLPAFRARMSTLRGQPVVVNKWASWCGPCQSEFPVFQRVAVHFGSKVAFLGLDGKDQRVAAAAFLRRFPVSYPSYEDPNEQIAGAIGAATYYPQTIYYDRTGKQVYVHAGPYLSAAELTRDIDFYVLR